jgi:catechol 2,3-dioxygenase-like lactoylglutathione lyase family enzyme
MKILGVPNVGRDAELGGLPMRLSEYKVVAGLAVSDMERAREFYEGKLGLSVAIDSGDNVAYRCAEGSVLHVYLSPDRAGGSTATLASWYVDDVEGVVDELTKRGVTFERYVRPGRQGRLLQRPRWQHPLDRHKATFVRPSRACQNPYSPNLIEGVFYEVRAVMLTRCTVEAA